MTKTKQILTVLVLAVLLAGGMVLHVALPDGETSRAERRKLAQFPQWSETFAEDLEDYLLDQFPLRDGFRTVKSLWTYYVLGQKDNNGVFISKDPFSEKNTVSKLDPVLDEKQVDLFIRKFTTLHEKYFPDSRVWCAVVPDKNVFLASEGYPSMDYETMLTKLETGMPWADVRRNLFNCLISDSYYTTDSHWRQEKLQWVLDDLELIMDVELPDLDTYEQTVLPGFHGVYYGQAALPMGPETLYILENELLSQCRVLDHETGLYTDVYNMDMLTSKDLYDVFLSGAKSLLTIENPNAATDRELIVFRDSFGSSMVPLLVRDYAKVTLVDIRYLSSQLLGRFLEFNGQDVLFLYSTLVLNNSTTIK